MTFAKARFVVDSRGRRTGISQRIRARIIALAEEPWPRGSIKIAAPNRRRLRVGDYRVIYDVDHAARVVLIRRAGHRKDLYR